MSLIYIENQESLNAALAERPVDSVTYGLISRNENTEQHGATLESLKYKVISDDDHFAVAGTFLRAKRTDVVDISSLEKAIGFCRAVVANKRLINYAQRFKLPNGKVLFRGPVLAMLGSKTLQDALGFNPTALIAKKGVSPKKKKAKPSDPWAVQSPSAPVSADPFAAPAPVAPKVSADPFAAPPTPAKAVDPFAAPVVARDPFATV